MKIAYRCMSARFFIKKLAWMSSWRENFLQTGQVTPGSGPPSFWSSLSRHVEQKEWKQPCRVWGSFTVSRQTLHSSWP